MCWWIPRDPAIRDRETTRPISTTATVAQRRRRLRRFGTARDRSRLPGKTDLLPGPTRRQYGPAIARRGGRRESDDRAKEEPGNSEPNGEVSPAAPQEEPTGLRHPTAGANRAQERALALALIKCPRSGVEYQGTIIHRSRTPVRQSETASNLL